MTLLPRIRVIPTRSWSGAMNMALDQVLLAQGQAALRLYQWERPCLSLGKLQKDFSDLNPSFGQAQGVELVRRATGGQAVLHHLELTYSFIGPIPPFGKKILDSYAQISHCLQLWLQSLGIKPQEAGLAKFRPQSSHCFLEPGAKEILIQGKKLIGSAQVRQRHAFLQHGAMLLDLDAPLWQGLWPQADAARFTSLQAVLGRRLLPQEWEPSLPQAFAQGFAAELVVQDFTPEELAQAEAWSPRYQVDWRDLQP